MKPPKSALIECVMGLLVLPVLLTFSCTASSPKIRSVDNFGKDWKFYQGEVQNGHKPGLNDSQWRTLDLPHDWSIEGKFTNKHPATAGGGCGNGTKDSFARPARPRIFM